MTNFCANDLIENIELVEKIKMVCTFNRTKINGMTKTALVDFLWEYDCIRGRVINKAEIEEYL